MQPLLKTNRLSLSIENKLICRNLNLEIKAGDIWGVLGPNGSGKTTLLHSLAGLHSVLSGEIILKEKNIKELPRKSIAKQIGILFQDTQFIFPQTVLEYCYASRHPHEKNKHLNDTIILQAIRDMELETFSIRNVLNLSGGEKRRLAISALLAQTPQVYLLDEPTNHLDIRYQYLILNHFKSLIEKNTCGIMLALHDIKHARQFCNKILMIFPEGEVLSGSTQEMLTQTNLNRLYQYIFEDF